MSARALSPPGNGGDFLHERVGVGGMDVGTVSVDGAASDGRSGHHPTAEGEEDHGSGIGLAGPRLLGVAGGVTTRSGPESAIPHRNPSRVSP